MSDRSSGLHNSHDEQQVTVSHIQLLLINVVVHSEEYFPMTGKYD